MSARSTDEVDLEEQTVTTEMASSGKDHVATGGNKRDWKYGLFGCMADSKLCVLTFCSPCYAIGKNTESVGENCLLHGLLAIVGLNFAPVTRWRMRQERGIDGSMLLDVLVHSVCPCCALVQEAREIGWGVPKDLDEIGRQDGAEQQTISRE